MWSWRLKSPMIYPLKLESQKSCRCNYVWVWRPRTRSSDVSGQKMEPCLEIFWIPVCGKQTVSCWIADLWMEFSTLSNAEPMAMVTEPSALWSQPHYGPQKLISYLLICNISFLFLTLGNCLSFKPNYLSEIYPCVFIFTWIHKT